MLTTQNNMRQAQERDISRIMEIVAATLPIMHSEGNFQWSEQYPTADVFGEDIAQANLFVYDDGGVGGFVCLNDDQPSEYQGKGWSNHGPSLCIHRLAVCPVQRGQGVGSALLAHAENKALERGISYVRTDTFSGNAKMNRLFARLRYRKTGEVYFGDIKHPFYCYDKILEGQA